MADDTSRTFPRYTVLSRVGVIGHTGAELSNTATARTWVLVPGPAFTEAWAIISAAHELLPRYSAALRVDGNPAEKDAAIKALPESELAQEHLARRERVDSLRLELREEEDGHVVADEFVSIHAFPAIYHPGFVIPEGLAAKAREKGFTGDPPYYTVTVLKQRPTVP